MDSIYILRSVSTKDQTINLVLSSLHPSSSSLYLSLSISIASSLSPSPSPSPSLSVLLQYLAWRVGVYIWSIASSRNQRIEFTHSFCCCSSFTEAASYAHLNNAVARKTYTMKRNTSLMDIRFTLFHCAFLLLYLSGVSSSLFLCPLPHPFVLFFAFTSLGNIFSLFVFLSLYDMDSN